MVTGIRVVALGVAFGIAVAAGACDGDSGSGNPVSTSVPGNKRINDLTPAERDQLCADVTAWAMSGPFLTDGCNASAWLAAYLLSLGDTTASDAELQTACQTLYADCVANGVMSSCSDLPTTCTATVSEYNMCLSDSLDGFAGIPACSTATRASLSANAARLLTPMSSAACTAVQTKCPDAM
jgi:hypothetical protein